jgi:hypothetical protein
MSNNQLINAFNSKIKGINFCEEFKDYFLSFFVKEKNNNNNNNNNNNINMNSFPPQNFTYPSRLLPNYNFNNNTFPNIPQTIHYVKNNSFKNNTVVSFLTILCILFRKKVKIKMKIMEISACFVIII